MAQWASRSGANRKKKKRKTEENTWKRKKKPRFRTSSYWCTSRAVLSVSDKRRDVRRYRSYAFLRFLGRLFLAPTSTEIFLGDSCASARELDKTGRGGGGGGERGGGVYRYSFRSLVTSKLSSASNEIKSAVARARRERRSAHKAIEKEEEQNDRHTNHAPLFCEDIARCALRAYAEKFKYRAKLCHIR